MQFSVMQDTCVEIGQDSPVTAEEYLWKPGVVWNRENYSVSHWSDNLKKGLTAGNEFDFSERCSCIQFGQVGSA